MRQAILLALLGPSLAFSQIHPVPARKGIVVSDSTIASEVGAQVMRDGGNAVDAAVATGLALAVTLPVAGNIGGGGFMMIRTPEGEVFALDFREIAPHRATRDMYLDADGNVATGRSTVGYLAAGTPGTVAGLWEAHKKYGHLPWERVVQPSINLARDGFEIGYGLAGSLQRSAELFRKFDDSWRIFARSGDFYEWGDNLKQPDLAATLTRVRDHGRDGFYEGETARLIADDMRAHGGLMDERDLADYQPTWREPVRGEFRGCKIAAMPPPSSGGVALLQMLGTLSNFELEHGTPRYYHLLVESMKRAFADRAEHMGDPEFTDVPVALLLEPDYTKRLAWSIRLDQATPSTEISPLRVPAKEGRHTTHFTVMDSGGLAVATTYTINTGFGSGVTVEGAGFLLNNEMDDFTSKPGVPNAYGLIQGQANAVAPLKRPLSSMTPTIVELPDGSILALGSPGGPTIINTVLQTILNVTVGEMNVQEAVVAPRLHHQWLPDVVEIERLMHPSVIEALRALGHKVEVGGTMGSCHAVLRDAKTGYLFGGVDPRVSSAGAAVW